MTDKIASEKDFHNREYTENLRSRLLTFHSVLEACGSLYKQSLASRCRGRKVLEYGCGPDSDAYWLAQHGAEVVGIDISEVAIEHARELAREKGVNTATFQVMNAEEMHFSDATFDMVCGRAIIHHLDLDKAYAELVRVLKPDGTVVFLEPLGHNPVINFCRWLTPKLRTPDEHPLTMRDLRLAQSYFGRVEYRFFHLLSLGAFVFAKFPGFPSILRLFDAVDQVIFRVLPFTRPLAWMCVMTLSAPKKLPAAEGCAPIPR